MKQVEQVLVAIDRSAMAEEVLKRAISVTKKKDAQLIVMHVVEPPFMESPYFKSIDEDEIRNKITDQINQLNMRTNVEYYLFVEFGSVADAITLKAQKTNADLLIVGSHGKGNIASEHFGSTTLKLIQSTHIPVLIVKNKIKQIYQKMLAPTDLSDYSKESILFANALFTKPSRKYIFAFRNIDELQAMTYRINDKEAEELREITAIRAKTEFKKFVKEVGEGEMALIDFKASINEDLLAYIKKDKADLLVLGSKGVDNLNSFVFGSTASYLVQRSPIDVLVYVPSTQ